MHNQSNELSLRGGLGTETDIILLMLNLCHLEKMGIIARICDVGVRHETHSKRDWIEEIYIKLTTYHQSKESDDIMY